MDDLNRKEAPRGLTDAGRGAAYRKEAPQGLTDAEVRARVEAGQVNCVQRSVGKTTGQILRENLLSLFNFLNLALAILVLTTGELRNALFMGVVVLNAVIGVYQELRAKRAVEKLALISAPSVHVLRNGREIEIKLQELVLDDVMLLSTGKQLCADARLLDGALEVDESLLTGESDPIPKAAGDDLLSGSFVVSGHGAARATAVGDQAYAAKLAQAAKRYKKPDSALMRALGQVIRVVSVIIVPIGALLFWKAYTGGAGYADAVSGSVAAMIGMIPEGLMLLTSIALAVGVIRLARRDTLAQSLYCMETLARVDTCCIDKTGTLTSGAMAFDSVIPLAVDESEAAALLARLLGALGAENATASALLAWLKGRGAAGPAYDLPIRAISFSSARKYSGAIFENGAYALGAPGFLCPALDPALQARVDALAETGKRVLLLARCGGFDAAGKITGAAEPLALFALTDVIRPETIDTLAYFRAQGVTVKVISGDNPKTVAAIAARVGLEGAEKAIDLSTLQGDAAVRDAATKYAVFGRVTPDQKRILVNALRAAGHIVCMIGDGVNDAPALRDADCAVAMGAGSDAARQVASLVLLGNDFAALPLVVREGRRVINNIRRSASLFLTKTFFSGMTALLTLLLIDAYPLVPIQLTLFSTVAIGIPSFLLALEPNEARVKSDFLPFVLRGALPGAVALCAGVVFLTLTAGDAAPTAATLYMLAVGLLNVLLVAWPLNLWRGGVLLLCTALAALLVFCFPGLFWLEPLSGDALRNLLLAVAAAIPALCLLRAGISKMSDQFPRRKHRKLNNFDVE